MNTPPPDHQKTLKQNELAQGCAWAIADLIILPPIVGGLLFILLPDSWVPFSGVAFFILLALYLTIVIPVWVVIRDRRAAQRSKTKCIGD